MSSLGLTGEGVGSSTSGVFVGFETGFLEGFFVSRGATVGTFVGGFTGLIVGFRVGRLVLRNGTPVGFAIAIDGFDVLAAKGLLLGRLVERFVEGSVGA